MINQIFGLTDQQLIGFWLTFLRIVALVVAAPILGSQSIPTQIKIFLALFLTICLMPVIKQQSAFKNLYFTSLAFKAGREIILGLFIGFYTKLIFEGFQFAGRIIGNQMGLGIAELIDPESGAQASPIGNFYSLTAILLFLILNGHHFIIAAIYETFRFIPLNTNSFISTLAVKQLLLAFNELFKIAIKIAAPALVTLFIIEVCMGIMARLVPQMNIFFIGLPVRLGIGLFILIASLPIFNLLLESFIKLWQRDLISLIKII